MFPELSAVTSPLLAVAIALTAVADHAAGDENAQQADSTETIACLLSDAALEARLVDLEELFAGHEEVRELDDGYSLRFPGDGPWGDAVLDFVRTERRCCPFFRFEIHFEPDSGPVWLTLGGTPEIKAFVASFLER